MSIPRVWRVAYHDRRTRSPDSEQPAHELRQRAWSARFAADYPHLPASARVPTLLAYGGSDNLLPPPLMQCTMNRLAADGVQPTVCIDPQAGHGGDTGIAAARGDHAAGWIASVTLGAATPAACSVASFHLGVTCPLPQ